MPQEPDASLTFLAALAAGGQRDGSYVVQVRTREEFAHWLREPLPGAEWLQVEGLLGDPEVWALAAQGPAKIPLDVILTDPAVEYSSLYRLVDVRIVRDVRVTIPAAPGCMKALRLASSLQLSVRLLPGQPDAAALAELTEAVHFYLHDPMVEAPVEPFHSLLSAFRSTDDGTLWTFLEQDPATFRYPDAEGLPLLQRDFVETHLAGLIEHGAECAACRWQPVCAGYFKWPDPAYTCAGVKALFATIEDAADEITRDLADLETSAAS